MAVDQVRLSSTKVEEMIKREYKYTKKLGIFN